MELTTWTEGGDGGEKDDGHNDHRRTRGGSLKIQNPHAAGKFLDIR